MFHFSIVYIPVAQTIYSIYSMHLLLSPHPDDIAYSLGGAVLKGYINEGILATVFQRSSHVPNINLKASIDEGSSIRFKEDRAYAQRVGLAYKGLSLKEAVDRGYRDFDAICKKDSYLTDHSRVENNRVIQSFLEELLERQQITTLWAPLAIGYHVDHVMVSRAVLNWKTKKKLEIIFYEDIPYAAYLDRASLDQWIIQQIGPAKEELIDISAVFQEKMRNIEIYKSQINEQDVAGLKQHALRLVPGFATERIWSKVD